MVMLMMLMSSYGLSVLGLTLRFEILWTTSMPLMHLPNTVCLLSSQGCSKDNIQYKLNADLFFTFDLTLSLRVKLFFQENYTALHKTHN